MKIGKEGLATRNITSNSFRKKFIPIWHKGRVAYKSIEDETLYIAKEAMIGVELIPFPPVYKVNIFINPYNHTGSIDCINISLPTQKIINDFVSNLFNEYEFNEIKEYQIHIRLDGDWNLRKVSIINSLAHEEDTLFTYLLSSFFKKLAEGKDINAFLTQLNLQKLLKEQRYGTMA